MVAVGFDTETHLIEPGLLAPPIVCASSATADGADRLFHAHRDKMPHGCIGAPIEHTSAREHFEWLLYQDPIFGSNIAYDIAVCMSKWPELANKIYDAYDDDRIVDVGLCQQLIDNADGDMLKGSEGAAYQSLTSLERLYLDKDREAQKHGPDVWRLRYKELEPVELHRWPRAAVVYPLDDARGPLQIGLRQLEKHAGLIKNAPAQSRAAFQLQLIMCWGVMVDPRMVRRLEEEARELYDKLTLLLVDQGLVRGERDKKPGTRDLRAAQRRMLLWYRMHNLPMKLTDKGIEKLMKLRVDKKTPVPDPKTVFSESELVQFLSVDEDACKETGDPVLIAYARRVQVHTILHTHVPDLLKGVKKPIQPKYWTMVASGRTSCSKGKKKGGDNKSQNGFQFQNPKRALDYFPPHVGIRECFIARPRRLFADPDFGQLELHTGAQACIATVGYSRLGEALNAGRDAHLQFGAKLMKISYEEAKARKHEKIVKFHRQLAKIWNFGKPGGLGVRGMVGYARGYGVRLTVEDCKKYDREWIEEFNEWEDYFSFIRKHIDITTGEGVIEQLYVSRIRGGVTFTSGSNTLFQGLAADGAKHALYEVGKRCYVPEMKSVLYGARPLGFIHDEILGEVFDEEDYAHHQATEMARVMVEACNKFLPDVPVRCAPSLCKRWSKDVEPIYDRSGYLLPYDLARERRQEAFYDAKATERVNWIKMEEEAIEKWHKAIGWEEQKAA